MCCVLQIHTNAGWEQGLADRLSQEPDIEVQSVTYTSEPTLLGDIIRIQPDAILLNKDGPVQPHQLRELLARLPAQSPVRIIVLSIHSNVLDIYDSPKRQQAVVTSFADFCQCIRAAPRVHFKPRPD